MVNIINSSIPEGNLIIGYKNLSKKINGISDSTPSKTMMGPVSPWQSTRKGHFEVCSTSTIT